MHPNSLASIRSTQFPTQSENRDAWTPRHVRSKGPYGEMYTARPHAVGIEIRYRKTRILFGPMRYQPIHNIQSADAYTLGYEPIIICNPYRARAPPQ